MSLNIVNNIDNRQFTNNQYSTYKKITKLPLISMQTNKNFVLIQNRKGKILNKPVFSGYTKNKLSSIPRDVEIILLNKEKDEILLKNDSSFNTTRTKDYIFNNQIYVNPFSNNNKISRSVSGYIPSPITENINNQTIAANSKNNSKSLSEVKSKKIQNNLSNITKTPYYWKYYKKVENHNYNNLSNSQNNLSFDEYQSQFYPGPSDYNVEKSFDKINQQNKYRYKSLFKKEINEKKKKKDDSPGPGSYLKMNNILNSNNRHLSINLGTKEKRFKNLFNNNNPLSPWFYSSSNKNNNNKNKENKINNINLYNNHSLDDKSKDFYDYHYYIIKEETTDKGEKRQFYLEDKNHKINDKEKSTKIILKPFDNVKFKEKRKFNVLLKKYINTNENKNYQVPGPGQYNIYMGFDKILKDNAIESLKNINKQEKLIPENVLKEFSLSKKDPSLLGNESIIEDNYLKKGIASKSAENIFIQENNKNIVGGTLPFLSKKKRIEFHDDLLLKHTPGPCYYYNDSVSHNNLPKKKLKAVFKQIIISN